ncbi:MAG TPA: DUF1080 domain-containing protein, partial [Humisphaera sp.]
DADGFHSLFNGKDLAGWVPVNVHPGTFSVKDGMIVSTGKPTGVMRSDRMYENFVIEIEWKHLTPGGNSGLFIWGDGVTAPGTPFARGVEVQILDEAYIDQHPTIRGKATGQGDVFPIHGATMVPDRPHPSKGSMRCLPSENRTRPAGEWNHYRVVCNDGVIKLSVNGKEVSGGSKCNPRKGYVCLESEGAPIHFRNLRIKELPSTNAPPEQTAKTDPNYTFLYNGIDLAGWDAKDPGHKGHWVPKDWTLDYDGKSAAADKTLWTEKAYGDFEMVVDWRLTGKPKAGGDAGRTGIRLRGTDKAEVALWCDPAGSGGVPGYDAAPKAKADRKPGDWNRTILTMRGDRLTVTLNGQMVLENARLSGVPATGRIGLADHGDPVQFASVFVKELPPAGDAKAAGTGARP